MKETREEGLSVREFVRELSTPLILFRSFAELRRASPRETVSTSTIDEFWHEECPWCAKLAPIIGEALGKVGEFMAYLMADCTRLFGS